jgi:hypothetical protein
MEYSGFLKNRFVTLRLIHDTKYRYRYSVRNGKGKGKATPVQAWLGPEGSRRLRLPEFRDN